MKKVRYNRDSLNLPFNRQESDHHSIFFSNHDQRNSSGNQSHSEDRSQHEDTRINTLLKGNDAFEEVSTRSRPRFLSSTLESFPQRLFCKELQSDEKVRRVSLESYETSRIEEMQMNRSRSNNFQIISSIRNKVSEPATLNTSYMAVKQIVSERKAAQTETKAAQTETKAVQTESKDFKDSDILEISSNLVIPEMPVKQLGAQLKQTDSMVKESTVLKPSSVVHEPEMQTSQLGSETIRLQENSKAKESSVLRTLSEIGVPDMLASQLGSERFEAQRDGKATETIVLKAASNFDFLENPAEQRLIDEKYGVTRELTPLITSSVDVSEISGKDNSSY
jgi:hypothetical protein